MQDETQLLESTEESEHRWAVILAGGEGKRLEPLVSRWLGRRVPKQYCIFVGSRSMLRHTVDRATRVVHPNHTVVIIGRGHRQYLASSIPSTASPYVIEQPGSCGTLPGIMLPAACISCRDSDPTLLILPSDHFIFPEDRFSGYASEALRLAEENSDRFVLIGTEPRLPETEYGWVRPGGLVQGQTRGFRVSRAEAFFEKPGPREASQYFEKGYLWNTMIIAVKASTLIGLAHGLLPDMAEGFDMLREAYSRECGSRFDRIIHCVTMSRIYSNLRHVDFSTELLQNAADQILVLHMEDTYWCDWGREDRIVEGLARIGKRPLFAAGTRNSELQLTVS